MTLSRLVVAIVNQIQTITSKGMKPVDSGPNAGKIEVQNSDGSASSFYEYSQIDWPNCGWTTIISPP